MKKNHLKKLFQPVKIGEKMVKNKILQCPMDPGPFVQDGVFQQRNANILIRRAKGGVGLVVTGCTLVENGDGTMFADHRDVFVPGAKKMMDEIHSYGGCCFIQLSAGVGRNLQMTEQNAAELPDIQKIAPSDDTPNVFVPTVKHRGMTVEHIKKIIKGFGDAAEVVKEAGFDGIEVHALHEGYLLDQFSIASINQRADEYGGSMENRLRFAREILEEIKGRCGSDFPVTIRFSVESKMKGYNRGRLPQEADVEEFGRSREEAGKMARALQDMGFDALNTDNGSYDAWYWAHPPVYMPQLCNLSDAEYIKKFVDIPVFCAGRMDDPVAAVEAVESGRIDGIALGRALLADPDWPNKVREGRLEDIRPCIACQSGCLRTFLGESMTCALNPDLGNDAEEQYEKAQEQKKIAVVGGGIGGMEFARVSTIRGHKVTLFEQTAELGGAFIAAAAPEFKESDKLLLKWFTKQLRDLNVETRLNTRITSFDELKQYDVVVVATGSDEKVPPLKGIDCGNVLVAKDALRKPELVKSPVVVVGGGLTGCEIAYDSARRGAEVAIVEFMKDILQVKGLCRANSSMLRDLLNYHNVEVLTNTKVLEIMQDHVLLETESREISRPCNTVVIATGYKPKDYLYRELVENNINCVNIGDSKSVGNLLTVIADARKAAKEI